MLDVLGQDFIRTARAKGLTRPPRSGQARTAYRVDTAGHAVRLRRGGLVTGAVFVEKIFGLATAWVMWMVQGLQPGHQHRRRDHGVRRSGCVTRRLALRFIYAALDPGCECHDGRRRLGC